MYLATDFFSSILYAALASQSLSIMIALIPYIRETFRRHLNPKQAVMLVEFDKLKRDYQEHQNEIHAKLIAIMGDRLAAHIKTLRGVQWDRPGPAGKQVNDYMELLVKETVTLHKVLSRYLASAVVEVSLFCLGRRWLMNERPGLVRDVASLCCYQPSTVGGILGDRASDARIQATVRIKVPRSTPHTFRFLTKDLPRTACSQTPTT